MRNTLADVGSLYTKKSHMDWVDEYNFGISHFGLDPNLFPLCSIRFDTFHLRSAITRQLLSSLRKFITAQTYECQKSFEDLLAKAWNSHFVFVWSANKPFTSLKGKQILAFIHLIPTVVIFINDMFVET